MNEPTGTTGGFEAVPNSARVTLAVGGVIKTSHTCRPLVMPTDKKF